MVSFESPSLAGAGVMIGHPAPDFELPSICADGTSALRTLATYRGRWLALMFYPRDFSFVCPTELTAFSARLEDFRRRNCRILAVSIDSVELHTKWLKTPVEQSGVGALRFPLASDTDGRCCRAYGVWNSQAELANRGLFLIDPNGDVQYSVIHSLSVGRSVEEVLRVLDALRSGGLCPANWTKADGTLDVNRLLGSGRVLGHYRVEQELGRGSFASVFSAWDQRLERWVALKILRRAGSDDKDILGEARSAAAINHPNVCSVHAVEEIDGLPVIVMELLEGQTLAALISAGDYTSPRRELAMRIAEGLSAAHAQGVTHGDLKPANVLVVDGVRPVIVDFGLARTRSSSDELDEDDALIAHPVATITPAPVDATVDFVKSTEAAPGQTAAASNHGGTPAYMAPEQVLGSPSSAPSDIFALGLVLYEIFSGERAVKAKTLSGVLQTLRDPTFGRQLSERVAPAYREIIELTLHPQSESRPSALEVALRLAEIESIA